MVSRVKQQPKPPKLERLALIRERHKKVILGPRRPIEGEVHDAPWEIDIDLDVN